MDTREHLNRVLGEIQQSLALDANGECAIETSDGDEVLVSVSDDTDQAVVSIPVANLRGDEREEMLEEALVINDDLTLTGPSRICYSREHDMLLLRYAVDAETIESAELEAVIVAVLELAEPIRDHLLSGGALEADAESDTEDPPDGEFPPGSIRA